MDLGREATNAAKIPIYAMPRMTSFLKKNGPWNQLVTLKNIEIRMMNEDSPINITEFIKITPFLVPHRDEYSETVGFQIEGMNKKAIFIPDIDKWSKWNTKIAELVQKVDYAFLDGTFYNIKELPNRNMEEIPHPFVVESMALFSNDSPETRRKIYFIHLNHSNPLLQENSSASQQTLKNGFNISRQGQTFKL
jgi:pyrroloquinoline quinone biosynthesis protein B